LGLNGLKLHGQVSPSAAEIVSVLPPEAMATLGAVTWEALTPAGPTTNAPANTTAYNLAPFSLTWHLLPRSLSRCMTMRPVSSAGADG
jgi:hypothetical protein